MIAIISDIHGNLPALNSVLEAINKLGCSRIISLGDVTGYYTQPGECIDILKELNVLHLRGNHDEYLIKGTSCPRSVTVSRLIEFQRKILSRKHLKWLAASPRTYHEGENYFVHGGWNDPIDEYLYKVNDSVLPKKGKRFFSGHTHVQILAEIGGKFYCNPGSVGQPRDGDPRAAFAVLTEESIILHRISYDIDATVQAARNANMPSKIYKNLYSGTRIGGRIDRVIIDA